MQFTVYEAATGRIVATPRTETQARNIAAALGAYKGVTCNVTVARPSDVQGGNAHEHFVRLDEV